MSFTSEFNALQKKKKKTGHSFTDEFLELQGEEVKATLSTTDIAPVRQTATEDEEEKHTWFQKGAFEDGYQFGDVFKTIEGTARDAETGIMAGILGIGEKVVDAGAYLVGGAAGLFGADEFKEKTADFIAKDLYDERAIAKQLVEGRNPLVSLWAKEGNSVLGEKSDALVESGGQLLGTIGLQAVGVPWYVTSGATSFGAEAEGALDEGASYGEAGLSAVISAGAEILTEKLFGGSGLGENGLINLEPLTKGISNKVVKVLADLGVDMFAEGSEEVVSSVFSNLGSALYKEENLGELLFSEEAVDEYIESFIGGAALGGVANVGKAGSSIATGRDYRTGLTQNEQSVVDKVFEERVAEKEKGGKELTKKEKAELYEKTIEDMAKGKISVDTIEEVLGGEDYKAYKNKIAEEEAILKEYEELGNLKDATLAQQARYITLGDTVKDIKTKSQSSFLGTQLSEKVFGMAKNDRLVESYKDQARRTEKLKINVADYDDENAKKTVQNAMDSGFMNNGVDAHEFVDFAAKVSKDTGYEVDFVTSAKLAELKANRELDITADPNKINALVSKKNKKILVNMDTQKSLPSLVGHEITHTTEGSGHYEALKKAIFKYAETKGEYETRRKDIEGKYDSADVDTELVADLAGDYLFTDSKFVEHLSVTDRNLFQRVWDEIKHLYKMATAGSREARELERVQHEFERVYRESAKANKQSKTDAEEFYDSSTKYSLRVTDKDTLEFLDNQETVTTYKTMQLVDGKLYPPMASRIEGQFEDHSELGTWEQATEHPELIKNGNKFKLDKGKGQGSIEAAYNPYMHSSNLVLNDQFSGAYKRDNLVTVECEVPVSELTSGYHAEFAKDSVGWHPWHTGTVAGQLRQAKGTERQVFLSRWIKPVRIVPDSEVAAMYKDLLDGTDVEVPDNVVTPALLKELKNAGVKIKESGRVQYSLSDSHSKAALEHFGTTTDYNKAGFIIENGSMLNFGQSGVNGRFQHRSIEAVFEEKGADTVNRFIQEGNVRIMATSPGIEIGTETALSQRQIEAIGRFATQSLRDRGVFYLDITDPDGNEVATKTYYPDSDKYEVMYDIEDYYGRGDIPKERVRYSLSDSDGKQLTKEQSEYFKDSKVRDENGNLKVMYHGSQDAGFHVFDPVHSDDETSLFFVDRNDVAASYSGTSETYEAQTIHTAEDMNNFIESIGAEGYEVVEKDGKFTLLYEGDRVADSNSAKGIYEEFCWYEGVGEGDANYKVYLNLTNPLVVDAEGRNWNNVSREYSQEVADRYNSLTAEEKEALVQAAAWEEISIFRDEVRNATEGALASAYEKLGGRDANIYDMFTIASDNFSEESINQFAVKQMKTRDYAAKAKAEGYDGVIFNNIVDVGGYGNGSEGASTVAIAFSSEQIKSVANEKPTGDPDIRYSLSDNEHADNNVKVMDGGSVTRYSLSTWTHETQTKVRENLIKVGYDSDKVDKWIKDTNSVASVIAADKDRLDFVAADNQVMLKDNQEYIKTLDASTLCAKRLVYQGTFDAIQHRMPNTMLSSDDLIDLLNMMKAHGVQTPCGVCYVESRRRHLPKFAQGWLDTYNGEYKPNLDEVTTSDGLEALRKSHPQTYKDFVDAMNKKGSSNPKVVQLRTEYRNEIMSLTPKQIRDIEAIGGLRVQSFSDFETPHMLDMMQAVMDMSAKGLHSQAYTKVPNFAWVFGDTGIKINLSLIAEGDGFDADGNLAFSSTEGMDINEAMKLRDAYSQNVGTIIVGANDKHILACMADDRIDFIIPFHRSGWGMKELEMMGMSSYTDYTYGQKEHDLATGKGVANLYPPDYWDYNLSGKENAERYLNLCAKTGREPKFSKFLVNNGDGSYSLQPDGSTDGYWKTLIDFKMYDNEGNGAAQQKVQPNFNMDEAYRVLGEYEGGANKLPVANDVVEEFVAKYQSNQELAPAMSLSTEIDGAKEYGDFNIYAKDIRYTPTEVAPVREDLTRATENATVNENAAAKENVVQGKFEGVTEDEQYEAIRPKRETQTRMKRAEPRMKRVDAEDARRGGTEERSWYETSSESEAVDGKVTPDDIPDELRYYQVKSNKKTLETANSRLAKDGFEKSKEYFEGRMRDRKLTTEDLALGERLIQEAVKAGNYEAATDLIVDVSVVGTELGQMVQALSIIQRLTPEGQLRALHRVVERGKAKGDKAFDGVEVTKEMDKRILSTRKSDGTFDKAELDRAVEDVKKEIADKMKVSFMDKVNAWRYLSMLGNPKTHGRNMISNVAMLGTRVVKNAVARTIETIAPIENRTKTWRAASDTVKAFAKETTKAEADTIKGENKYSEAGSLKAERKIFKSKILQPVNWASDLNSKALGWEDSVFSKFAYKRTLQEYLTANGIRTEADIKNNPEIITKAKNHALAEARRATFQQDSYIANKISEIERKNVAFGVAIGSTMPFKKTPINIAKTGAAYSPLGFARNVYDLVQVKKGNMDASEAIDHLAQTITGTSLALIGYALAEAGLLNGAGDDDKEGEYDYQLGRQSYSFNFGGDTYSLNWLSPVAMPLFVGANAYEGLVEKEEWDANMVIDTLGQTLDPMSEMSFLSSLDSVLSSYDSGVDKIMAMGESMAQNYVTQFAPTLLSQVAQATDDVKRSTKPSKDSGFTFGEETVNKIKYKIPGLRQTLEPTTDVWGNDVKQTEDIGTRLFESFLSPANKRNNITTAVDEELKDLYSQVGDSALIPSIPDNYINYDGTKYEMDAKDHTEYKKLYGQTAFDLMEDLFATDTYKNATSEERADMVGRVYDYARDEARKSYFTKFGVDYTNAEKEGKEYYKENPIKGAIEADLPVDEYSFSVDYPAKYKFFKNNGISYDTYKSADEDGKRAYTWAYENPAKYEMSKAITGDVVEYRRYASELYDIRADKDEYGDSIVGSAKEKKLDYINNLDLDYGQKIILFKSLYNADDTYNYDIIDYLNSRDDISYKQMETILKELGFKVDSKGNISWD